VETNTEDLRKPQQVASALLQQIQESKWAVGERLPSERQLSKELGVSRNAIREALTALQLSGHIETRLGEGSFVTQPDPTPTGTDEAGVLAGLSIADALEIRESLEIAAATLAVRRARRSDVLRINSVVSRMKERLDRRDYGAYLAATLDLHLEIAGASHSQVLLKLSSELMEKHRTDQWVLQGRYTPEVGAYSFELHAKLAKAIETRDLNDAVEATCRHYEDYPVFVK
jgi:DNA-binding FadR family transcriptional regulator